MFWFIVFLGFVIYAVFKYSKKSRGRRSNRSGQRVQQTQSSQQPILQQPQQNNSPQLPQNEGPRVLQFGDSSNPPPSNQNRQQSNGLKGYYLAPANFFELDIVGEHAYQDNLTRIAGGKKQRSTHLEKKAVLVLENSNPYDNNAVRVDIDNLPVGYLSRADAKRLRKASNCSNYICDAVISGGWKTNYDEGDFGVKLDLTMKRYN